MDFSERINDLDITETNYFDEGVHSNFLKIYNQYRDFINRIYFREVTPQEQGIELYNMIQEHLKVEQQAKELEKEYEKCYHMIHSGETKEAAARMKIFTILGTLFVVPSFLFALLKSKYFADLNDIGHLFDGVWCPECFRNLVILLSIMISVTISVINWKTETLNILNWKIKNWQLKKYFMLFLSTILIVLFLLIHNVKN